MTMHTVVASTISCLPRAQECLNKCRELLRQSTPVLFFPEARR